MQTRTTQSTVRFSGPFHVSGIDGQQPAGAYLVDQDEELIEGVSFLAYRRVGTFIHLTVRPPKTGSQLVSIDPLELDALLESDHGHTAL